MLLVFSCDQFLLSLIFSIFSIIFLFSISLVSALLFITDFCLLSVDFVLLLVPKVEDWIVDLSPFPL